MADEEEEDMFPLASKLGDEELETLGKQMAARADELTAEAEQSASRLGRLRRPARSRVSSSPRSPGASSVRCPGRRRGSPIQAARLRPASPI